MQKQIGNNFANSKWFKRLCPVFEWKKKKCKMQDLVPRLPTKKSGSGFSKSVRRSPYTRSESAIVHVFAWFYEPWNRTTSNDKTRHHARKYDVNNSPRRKARTIMKMTAERTMQKAGRLKRIKQKCRTLENPTRTRIRVWEKREGCKLAAVNE